MAITCLQHGDSGGVLITILRGKTVIKRKKHTKKCPVESTDLAEVKISLGIIANKFWELRIIFQEFY